MAQAIHCDTPEHREVLADVMVSQTANGDTSAWCFGCYVEVCRQVVATVEATIAEAAAADREAAERLEGSSPGPGEAVNAADQAHLDEQARMADELGVSTFRPAGDQPEPESLGGPETGGQGFDPDTAHDAAAGEAEEAAANPT